MPSWLGQAARRGLLTTRYPATPASPPEAPETARPPRPPPGTSVPSAAIDACPVRALDMSVVDDGKCIRCSRCIIHGLRYSGPVETSTDTREALVRGIRGVSSPSKARAPLASFRRSVHVFMVDVGSCNSCNLEVLALANPFYDTTRLGVFFTNSPRHADVLLVVGVPTAEMREPLLRAFEAIPGPKAVVAAGVCPISGGVFAGNPGVLGPVGDILPVDVFIPGCPPTPVNLIDGLLRAAGRSRSEEDA